MTTLNYSDREEFQWRSAAGSLVFHTVSVLILIVLPVHVVRTVVAPRASVTLVAPQLERPETKVRVARTLPPPPPPVKNSRPPEIKLPVPKQVPQRPQVIEPAPAPAPAPAVASVAIPKPALPDRPVIKAPPIKVQEGGFGEPIGTKETSVAKAKMPLPSVGTFDLPPGAGEGNGRGATSAKPGVVASSGFESAGEGTKVARAGGAVKTGGFGDGNGPGGHGTDPVWRRGTVQAGGFDAAPPAPKTEKPRIEAPVSVTPVEILFKPKPIYTDEARKLRIEGEVLLKIVFAADKTLKVLDVTRRLGHGLDEAAVQAAQQIRFNPALREGRPVDFTANVRIFFQLAN